MAQVVEHLPGKFEALNLIPQYHQKEKEIKRLGGIVRFWGPKQVG
jgi:hypothetical protein